MTEEKKNVEKKSVEKKEVPVIEQTIKQKTVAELRKELLLLCREKNLKIPSLCKMTRAELKTMIFNIENNIDQDGMKDEELIQDIKKIKYKELSDSENEEKDYDVNKIVKKIKKIILASFDSLSDSDSS